MRTALLTIGWLVLVAAVAAAAGSPSSRPSALRSRGPGPAFPGFRREDPAKFEEAEKFFRTNSPQRYEAFQKLGEHEKQKYREYMLRLYGGAQWLEKQGDKELLENQLRQIGIDDRIFATRMALRIANISEEEKEQLRRDLRDQVRQRLEARLEERTTRVQRMRQFLETEQQRIASDRAKLDGLVDREYQQELNSLPRGFEGPDGRRPGWGKEPDPSKKNPREPRERED